MQITSTDAAYIYALIIATTLNEDTPDAHGR